MPLIQIYGIHPATYQYDFHSIVAPAVADAGMHSG
jgi:hypothetical protein